MVGKIAANGFGLCVIGDDSNVIYLQDGTADEEVGNSIEEKFDEDWGFKILYSFIGTVESTNAI